jgi:hypothetical protein
MRYYDLIITPDGSSTPFRRWTSYPNGSYDPCALNIEFDMPVLPYHTPSGGGTVTVHGIALEDLGQAQQFAGMTLTLRAGMKAGFPLANPAQAGLILTGSIIQSFGNWEGTEQSLDFVLNPSIHTFDNPGNFSLNWLQNQPLGDALKQTLSIVYPGMPISMNISPNLVNSFDQPHVVGTLEELAQQIEQWTRLVFQNPVKIAMQGGKIIVYDKTHSPGPIQMVFTDFIGQPTWIDNFIMQVKTVLRADLEVGSIITMPQGMRNGPGSVGTSPPPNPASIKNQSIFQNSFQVTELRQIGNSRSSDAADWCTVFSCVANP